MPILNWLNRDKTIKESAKVPYRLLKAKDEFSYGDKDAENMIIQGDNLDGLKALLPYYASKVKCIYIDPPYNTRSFQNEHYDDNLERSVWLSKMYPRLDILYQLLSDDGLISIQIDDHNFAFLYLIVSEIFGNKNLKTICVKMSESTGVKMASVNASGTIAKLKEHIILASKNGIKNLNVEKIPKEKWDQEYKTVLLGCTKEELEFVKNLSELAENNEEIIPEDIEKANNILLKAEFANVKDVCKKETGKSLYDEWLFSNAWRIIRTAALTGGAKDIAFNHKRNNNLKSGAFAITTVRKNIYYIKSDFNLESELPRCKILFADKYLTIHPGDFWHDIKTTGLDYEGGIEFNNGKKPERLIQRIIKLSTNENDLVLDSFLGSGTTAAVAHKMNRRYIGIEMGEHAKTHCVERLKKVVDGEQGGISKSVNWQGGGGFRFYELGEAIFDDQGKINKNIKFEHLAAHIWFSETKTPFIKKDQNNPYSPFLGIHQGVAYYLLYNGILGDKRPHGGNVLTSKILSTLEEIKTENFTGEKVIYGETSRIGPAKLLSKKITFKQTPYDIKSR